MADIAVQDVGLDGTGPTYDAADGAGDRFKPRTTEAVLMHLKNSDTASHTVTLDDPTSTAPSGATAFDPDVATSVPAGGEVMVAVSQRFVDVDGWVNVDYSAATGMSIGVFRMMA